MVFCLASLCLSYETNVNVMLVNAALAVECTCGTIASVVRKLLNKYDVSGQHSIKVQQN